MRRGEGGGWESLHVAFLYPKSCSGSKGDKASAYHRCVGLYRGSGILTVCEGFWMHEIWVFFVIQLSRSPF